MHYPHDVFERNWMWQQTYLGQVQHILQLNAAHLIRVELATSEQDIYQSTDMVLRINGNGTVAVRLRRPDCQYRDLTLRSRSKYGNTTELTKIRDQGWAEWYVYGWTDDRARIAEWILVDLNQLRQSGLLWTPRTERPNGDGTQFVAYRLPELIDAKALAAGIVNGKQYQSADIVS